MTLAILPRRDDLFHERRCVAALLSDAASNSSRLVSEQRRKVCSCMGSSIVFRATLYSDDETLAVILNRLIVESHTVYV